jgi:3-methyl-2-oxobutanoate hydroxymethyltransferase
VVEGVPSDVGAQITTELQMPTIGIGAGPGTDAQVLVINDLLGINEDVPKLAKKYADLHGIMTEAVTRFVSDVETGAFPDKDHSYR